MGALMGVYLVDKPLGLTSFDVVSAARRAFSTRRVGHAGTLDPLATGLLVIATDTSTRLVPYLTGHDKDYLALISLGAATATLDAEGPITFEAPVASSVVARAPAALASLVGDQDQIPPQFSAIHVNGGRAYAAARAGNQVDLAARRVTVHSLTLLATLERAPDIGALAHLPSLAAAWPAGAQGASRRDWPEPLGDYPTLVVQVTVSAGTYVRAIARDLGERLGVPAHLSGLVRTRVGGLELQAATALEDLASAAPVLETAACGLPLLSVNAHTAKDLRDGKRLPGATLGLVAATLNGQLVAILEGDGVDLRVRRAWPSA